EPRIGALEREERLAFGVDGERALGEHEPIARRDRAREERERRPSAPGDRHLVVGDAAFAHRAAEAQLMVVIEVEDRAAEVAGERVVQARVLGREDRQERAGLLARALAAVGAGPVREEGEGGVVEQRRPRPRSSTSITTISCAYAA